MFKNKGFFVKVVPDPKPTFPTEHRARVDYNAIYDRTVHNAAKLMATYILADTARKILIHTAESKIR